MKINKKIFFIALFFVFFVPYLLLAAINPSANDSFGLNYVKNGENGISLGQRDPREMASQIINTVLTVLGVVSVGLSLLGGFKWMTSFGSEEKIGQAKKLLISGIVGLFIILAAWGITSFVLNVLIDTSSDVSGFEDL